MQYNLLMAPREYTDDEADGEQNAKSTRDPEAIYEDFVRYEQMLRCEHKRGLVEFVARLRKENRQRYAAFIGMLEESRMHTLPIRTYQEFVEWWSSLEDEEQGILDGTYQEFARQSRKA